MVPEGARVMGQLARGAPSPSCSRSRWPHRRHNRPSGARVIARPRVRCAESRKWVATVRPSGAYGLLKVQFVWDYQGHCELQAGAVL